MHYLTLTAAQAASLSLPFEVQAPQGRIAALRAL